MKAKLTVVFAAMLFVLGCGSDWNPVATDLDTSLYSEPCNPKIYESVPPQQVEKLPCDQGGG